MNYFKNKLVVDQNFLNISKHKFLLKKNFGNKRF